MKKAVDRVIDALQPLADKIGEGAEVVWEAAIQQSIITGWFSLISAGIFGAITLVLVLGGMWIAKDGPDPFDGVAFAIVVLLIGGTLTAIMGYQATTHLLNPEWQAIQSLAEQVK